MTAPHPALQSLKPQEQAILHLKALIGAATGKTVFMDCLNRLPRTSTVWTNKTLTPALEVLHSKRLLTDEFACTQELLHPLAVEALASADGVAMIEAIRAILPHDSARAWDSKVMEVSTLRWQRLAVLLNDESAFQRASEFHKRRTYHAAPSTFETHFANVVVGTDWLASRTPWFQYGIMLAKAILAEITKLRQACCHPDLATPEAGVPAAKLEAFLELVAELREGRHRALVFSQFVSHLSKVRAALDADGISYQYLDGSTPVRERDKRVAAFQAGEGELFLISLKAGGFGLNLTAADYVVHLDPWWNPAVEDQASDRAHRIGQQRPVTIYRLIVKDSIEEGIVALHRRKRDISDALLEGADASGRLSEEDLLHLIRGAD